jgi:hypothetical protein
MQCSRCNHPNRAGDRFCAGCGLSTSPAAWSTSIGDGNSFQGTTAIGNNVGGNLYQQIIGANEYARRAEDYINELTGTLYRAANETSLMTDQFLDYTNQAKNGADKAVIRSRMARDIAVYARTVANLNSVFSELFQRFHVLFYGEVKTLSAYVDRNAVYPVIASLNEVPKKIYTMQQVVQGLITSLQNAAYHYNRAGLDCADFDSCTDTLKDFLLSAENSIQYSCMLRTKLEGLLGH